MTESGTYRGKAGRDERHGPVYGQMEPDHGPSPHRGLRLQFDRAQCGTAIIPPCTPSHLITGSPSTLHQDSVFFKHVRDTYVDAILHDDNAPERPGVYVLFPAVANKGNCLIFETAGHRTCHRISSSFRTWSLFLRNREMSSSSVCGPSMVRT